VKKNSLFPDVQSIIVDKPYQSIQ